MRLLVGSVVLVVVVAIAQIAIRVHGHLPPGGYALLGVLGGMALVGIAKALAALGLQQPLAKRRDD